MTTGFAIYVRGVCAVHSSVGLKIYRQSARLSGLRIPLRYFSSHAKQSTSVKDAPKIQLLLLEHKKVKLMLFDVMKLVEKLVHLDELIAAQSKVMETKDALMADRGRKTDILLQLNRIREQQRRCQDQMHTAPRGSEQHLSLLREESKLLEEERFNQLEFTKADELERENFAKLGIAINNSHQKEQIYSHTLKNLGIICTLIGSLVSFLGASIGFYLHNRKSGMLKEEFQEALKVICVELKEHHPRAAESWGAYLKRHTVGIYRWFWPAGKK